MSENSFHTRDKLRMANVEDRPDIEPGKIIRLKGEDTLWYVRWMGGARKRGPWKWNVGGIEGIGNEPSQAR